MPPNVTISRIALPGYHQSLLGNQGAILGSPLGNHLPIKFGKPWIGRYIHGSNIFALRRATQSAVMQWHSGNDPTCHTRGCEFDPWTVQYFFSFLLNFGLFEAETD